MLRCYAGYKEKALQRIVFYGCLTSLSALERHRPVPVRHEAHGRRPEKSIGRQIGADPVPAHGYAAACCFAGDRRDGGAAVLVCDLRDGGRLRELRHDEGPPVGWRDPGLDPGDQHYRVDHLPELHRGRVRREQPAVRPDDHRRCGSRRRVSVSVYQKAVPPAYRRDHRRLCRSDAGHEHDERRGQSSARERGVHRVSDAV